MRQSRRRHRYTEEDLTMRITAKAAGEGGKKDGEHEVWDGTTHKVNNGTQCMEAKWVHRFCREGHRRSLGGCPFFFDVNREPPTVCVYI